MFPPLFLISRARADRQVDSRYILCKLGNERQRQSHMYKILRWKGLFFLAAVTTLDRLPRMNSLCLSQPVGYYSRPG